MLLRLSFRFPPVNVGSVYIICWLIMLLSMGKAATLRLLLLPLVTIKKIIWYDLYCTKLFFMTAKHAIYGIFL